jgi:hypothetical protein
VNGRRIVIECQDWCVTDHVAENERHLEDVAHRGAPVDLVLPGVESELQLLAYARLGEYPFGDGGRPFVVIGDSSGPVAELTPEQAEAFADRLERFAASVRAHARSARP